jgi:hypothetical protein
MVAVVGLMAQAAWAQTLPGFRQMAGTSRVAFFSRGGSDFGGRQKADVKRTDAFLARMEKTLAQPLAAPISYYTYERPEDIAAQTGVYAYGLTRAAWATPAGSSTRGSRSRWATRAAGTDARWTRWRAPRRRRSTSRRS